MSMRRLLLVAVLLGLSAAACSAQVSIPPGPPIYTAPGYYGTLYGVPNYGAKQAYSRFASPYGGPGYGLGYDPYSILPGSAGKGIWSPDYAVLGYSDSSGPYRTFRAIPVPEYPSYLPAFGYYAPAFGPPFVIE
jgi:hypothetical protein